MQLSQMALDSVNHANYLALPSGDSSLTRNAMIDSAASPAVSVEAHRHLRDLLISLGADPATLLPVTSSGSSAFSMDDADTLRGSVLPLLEHAAARTDCPDLGMRLAALRAANGATSVLSPLDVVMRSAPTLGEAFQYWAEHIHACSTASRICFQKLPDRSQVFMLFEMLPGESGSQRQAVEYALMLARHAVQALSQGRTRAREVWFTHEPLAPLSTYRANCGATVRFSQNMNGLVFDAQDLDRPAPDADPQLYEIGTRIINRNYPAATMTLSTRVRIIIDRLLVEGDCTPQRVGAALGLHPRTLQRRLKKEGESVESIKDSVRRTVALRVLQQPNVPLERLTEILGYSESSVLSRSCLRWFSASPRKLRNDLRMRRLALG